MLSLLLQLLTVLARLGAHQASASPPAAALQAEELAIAATVPTTLTTSNAAPKPAAAEGHASLLAHAAEPLSPVREGVFFRVQLVADYEGYRSLSRAHRFQMLPAFLWIQLHSRTSRQLRNSHSHQKL